VWLKIEKFIFPKLKTVFTVSQSIADIYSEKYKVNVLLLRNFPLKNKINPPKKIVNSIILYQGAINKDRGIEELVLAMRKINGYKLLIIGAGDVFDEVQKLIHLNNLEDRVELLGRVSFDELDVFTSQAVLAVSLEKRTSKSYEYALPNKIFDYIKNEVPILVSNLPEMKGVVEKYLVGELIDEISPESIAERINTILLDTAKLQLYSLNCRKAHEELNWENESQIIVKSLSE
jgi:glycosyltransferase involved in cell wall biosynthesis